MNHKLLINFDTLLRPLYVFLNIFKWGKKKPVCHEKFIVLKLFGLGSITRIVHVMNTVNINKEQVLFITLYQNKMVIDLLGLNAIYIETKNPIQFIISVFQVVIKVWKQRETSILDMERTSNISGVFRLIIGIRKPCNSIYFKSKNKYKRGQLFITMLNKPAVNYIAEMFHKNYSIIENENFREINSNKIFINVNAGDYCLERKFPITQYAILIKELHLKYPNWHFYLTGIKAEIPFVTSFQELLLNIKISPEKITIIAGQYNLSEFINCLKEARLFITNDSGPMHLAHLFKVKTVCIWGPTSSKLIGYNNSKKMLNLESILICSPCFFHPKSTVAKYCQNELTCFKTMNPKEMASKIIQFSINSNLKNPKNE
uniref:glycosyltransferase family 9 protein n=1 Tax=Flavobacterium sp. TaxID=239 RepID=UPI0040498EAB